MRRAWLLLRAASAASSLQACHIRYLFSGVIRLVEREKTRTVPTGYSARQTEIALPLPSEVYVSPLFPVLTLYTRERKRERLDYISADLDGIPRRRCFRIMWKASLRPLTRCHFCGRFNELVYRFIVTY